tara:strand:- start:7147 stop:7455 length:309 start_codon:yes stop_codon:yes gene_type:complete
MESKKKMKLKKLPAIKSHEDFLAMLDKPSEVGDFDFGDTHGTGMPHGTPDREKIKERKIQSIKNRKMNHSMKRGGKKKSRKYKKSRKTKKSKKSKKSKSRRH